ncbi:MAG: DUF3536 domain-containing protein [Candidatus Binataceae bacterium]|jgi:alpha-amylase/alpha-mannosidase (GH57 family)
MSECYAANGHAHTTDGHVVHIRNNYEMLNSDFGPTLMNWMARHGAAAYRAIRRGDTLSVERCDGHGNAIAQSYNHSILPTLSERDKEIQIAWGIEDFKFRFGHQPEGIWLPECGVDEATLVAVAEAGLKFTILSQSQGEFRPAPGQDGITAGPFLWRHGEVTLAVFRFDRDLAGQISFGDALNDGARLAELIVERALRLPADGAVLIATDGETFGHHKKSGAAELARAFEYLERRDDITVVNCAQYLAALPPAGGFEIHHPSAWSCAHGVERWRSNCGCRFDQGTSQEWRAPLREAMDFVVNHVHHLYDRSAEPLVKEPIVALKESIRLAIDTNPATSEDFFRRHQVFSESSQLQLSRLFEMERAAQATLTSCAWFFDDFGGLEGRVALRWAARAVELAAELAPTIERELLERLRGIHSNRREVGDAATLYLSVKTREARGRV